MSLFSEGADQIRHANERDQNKRARGRESVNAQAG